MTHHIQFAGFRYPACFFAVLFSLLTLPASGQEITCIIRGTVTDPSKAVVPGAAVKLTRDATGESKNVTTDADRMFAFLDIFPGSYTLSISAQGFKGLEKKNINLTSSDGMALGRIRWRLAPRRSPSPLSPKARRCRQRAVNASPSSQPVSYNWPSASVSSGKALQE
jgi:hypothetical protein